jgi:hypothetical protein
MQRLLFIGVGGTGGKTVRYLYRELERRLEASGWTGEMPRGWQFVHIDCPESPDILEQDVPRDVGRTAQYIGLGRNPLRYQQYDTAVSSVSLDALAGWRPDPAGEYISPYDGAGQRRAAGRVIVLGELRSIHERLATVAQTLGSAAVEQELLELGQHLGYADVGIADPGFAYVIGSLGGGSGSGITLDIVEAVRRTAATSGTAWFDSVRSILYTNEVFQSLPADSRSGIPANGLGAVSEILGAFYHEGGPRDDETALSPLGGGPLMTPGRRSSLMNFFVGSGNGNVNFTNPHQIYQACAKALTALHTNPAVTRSYASYIIANSVGGTQVPNFPFIPGGASPKPATALGYANVTLGRSLFRHYAAERLAHHAVDMLLEGHRSRFDRPDALDDATMARDLALQVFPSFLEQTGIRRAGDELLSILDLPRKKDELVSGLSAARTAYDESLARDSREMTAGDWWNKQRTLLRRPFDDYVAAASGGVTARAGEWTSALERNILEGCAWAAGTYGLPTTIALIDLLDNEFRAVTTELDRTVTGLRQHRDEVETLRVRGGLGQVVGTAHEFFQQLADQFRTHARNTVEAVLRELMGAGIKDARESMLPRVRSSLELSLGQLRTTALTGPEADERMMWSDGPVPRHLLPAPNEVLLDPVTSFPLDFERVLGTTFEATGAVGVQRAVEEVISGDYDRYVAKEQVNGQQLVEAAIPWVVERAELRPGSVPQAPTYRMALSPLSILRRAEAWVAGRDGAMRSYVQEQLGDWLGETAADRDGRAQRFAVAIETAVAASAPLITYSPSGLNRVHGMSTQPVQRIMSPIPLDHTALRHGVVLDALVRCGYTRPEAEALCNDSVTGEAVEISAFPSLGVHPIAMSSVYVASANDWRTRSNDDARRRYWQFARARRLPAAVGIGPDRQQWFVGGWFAARLLGYVDSLGKREDWDDAPRTIWTPRGRKPLPQHLLGTPVLSQVDVLPRLFESIPMAFAALGAGDEQTYDAFERILLLGAPRGEANDGLPGLHPALEAWCLDGELATPDPGFEAPPVPTASIAGTAADDPASRIDAVKATLHAQKATYDALGAEPLTQETTLTLRGAWEIRGVVQAALATMLQHVDRLAADLDEEPQAL